MHAGVLACVCVCVCGVSGLVLGALVDRALCQRLVDDIAQLFHGVLLPVRGLGAGIVDVALHDRCQILNHGAVQIRRRAQEQVLHPTHGRHLGELA